VTIKIVKGTGVQGHIDTEEDLKHVATLLGAEISTSPDGYKYIHLHRNQPRGDIGLTSAENTIKNGGRPSIGEPIVTDLAVGIGCYVNIRPTC
jgi:hypothetical protein